MLDKFVLEFRYIAVLETTATQMRRGSKIA